MRYFKVLRSFRYDGIEYKQDLILTERELPRLKVDGRGYMLEEVITRLCSSGILVQTWDAYEIINFGLREDLVIR